MQSYHYIVCSLANQETVAIVEFEWMANLIAKQSAMRYGVTYDVEYIPNGKIEDKFTIRRFNKSGFELELNTQERVKHISVRWEQ